VLATDDGASAGEGGDDAGLRPVAEVGVGGDEHGCQRSAVALVESSDLRDDQLQRRLRFHVVSLDDRAQDPGLPVAPPAPGPALVLGRAAMAGAGEQHGDVAVLPGRFGDGCRAMGDVTDGRHRADHAPAAGDVVGGGKADGEARNGGAEPIQVIDRVVDEIGEHGGVAERIETGPVGRQADAVDAAEQRHRAVFQQRPQVALQGILGHVHHNRAQAPPRERLGQFADHGVDAAVLGHALEQHHAIRVRSRHRRPQLRCWSTLPKACDRVE